MSTASFPVLEGGRRGEFSVFTYPYYKPRLETGGETIVAVGLEWEGVPSGLALGTLAGRNGAELLSLYVVPALRARGFGRELVSRLEEELRSRGAREVSAIFMADDGGPEIPFERILKHRGWETPMNRMVLCKVDDEHINRAPWYHTVKLPGEFSLFPWTELTEAEAAVIRANEGKPLWHHPELNPFLEGVVLDTRSSLGLRYKGEIAGWVVVHQVIEGALRYSSLFVRKDVRKGETPLALLAEAVRRHIDRPDYRSHFRYGMFNHRLDDPVVLPFFRRRISPYMIWTRLSRVSRKQLA